MAKPRDEVKLDTYNTETEALMIVDLLRAEGIPCVLVPVGAGQGAFGPSVWRPFEIRVLADDEGRARKLLSDLASDGPLSSYGPIDDEEPDDEETEETEPWS